MKFSRVHALARRYAAGELSLDEYRAQRRELIDGVTGGQQKLLYDDASITHRKLSDLRWAGVALLAAAAIGSVTFLWVNHSHRIYQRSSLTGAPPDTGTVLIRDFIETNDWSEPSLSQFLQRWKTLPAREKKALHHSYLYPRMVSQLQEQIVSQQAMVDLEPDTSAGADPASIHLKHLQQLAAALGVPDED